MLVRDLPQSLTPIGTSSAPRRLRRPNPFGRSGRVPRDRTLWNRDYGVSGTLSQEWQPASDRANGFVR